MVSTDQAASKAPLMKPDLDEIKRTAMAQAFPQYAAVNNGLFISEKFGKTCLLIIRYCASVYSSSSTDKWDQW